jgi:hypothetical protein
LGIAVGLEANTIRAMLAGNSYAQKVKPYIN